MTIKKPHGLTGNRNAARSDENAESFLHIRVMRSQKAAWVRKASSQGLKLSAWVAAALDLAAGGD